MIEWAFLFVHTPLPGENRDLNLLKQLPVAGDVKEKKSLSISVESGDLMYHRATPNQPCVWAALC